jgi:hypothetical protein
MECHHHHTPSVAAPAAQGSTDGRLEAHLRLEPLVLFFFCFLLIFFFCLLNVLDYVYGNHDKRPQIPAPCRVITTATTIHDVSSSFTTHRHINTSTRVHDDYDRGGRLLGAQERICWRRLGHNLVIVVFSSRYV